VSVSYALKQYDFVVHIKNNNNKDMENDNYIQLFLKYGILFKEYETDSLEQSLSKISKNLNLPVKNTVDYSILKVKSTFFQKL
jgi:hypothetical protein